MNDLTQGMNIFPGCPHTLHLMQMLLFKKATYLKET
jgi:hypothetical protein